MTTEEPRGEIEPGSPPESEPDSRTGDHPPWELTFSETREVEGGGRLTLEEFRSSGDLSPDSDDSPPPGSVTYEDPGLVSADIRVILSAAVEVDASWDRGDHPAVVAALVPVLDNERRRQLLVGMVPPDLVAEVTYKGGISRLHGGDPDGASEWLRIAVDTGAANDSVRRALAQVELSRGDLERAEELLRTEPDSAPMDLAIHTAVAGYRRDHDEVIRRVEVLGAAIQREGEDLHPWDQAGTYVLAGLALVEVGEWTQAMAMARAVLSLVEDAPPDLPLVAQGSLLLAAAQRLARDLNAADSTLTDAWGRFLPGSCDLGLAEREAARVRRASGRTADADAMYARAVATFHAAGERFLAGQTEAEARTESDR